MKCSARRKCQHCKEFYLPDRRNLHHQRYCAEAACRNRAKRKVSAAGCKNRRTKTTSAARKIASVSKSGENAIPVLAQKEPSTPRTVTRSLHDSVAQDEEVKRIEISDALQDVLVMQPAVMVGLISMMTGSALQEDIAATTRRCCKGQDILAGGSGVTTTHSHDENNRLFVQNGCACAAPL